MATTWSFKLLALTSKCRRTASVSLRICLDINLKFQPRFPGRRRQGFHSSMVHISAAVEHDQLDSGGAGTLGDRFADHLCRRDIVSVFHVLARFLVDRT